MNGVYDGRDHPPKDGRIEAHGALPSVRERRKIATAIVGNSARAAIEAESPNTPTMTKKKMTPTNAARSRRRGARRSALPYQGFPNRGAAGRVLPIPSFGCG
jgi:hypothetical protein